MDEREIKARVLAVLRSIAPEVQANELVPDRPLRSQVDLDSIDWLNVLIGIHQDLAIDIPEADYAKLVTLDNLVAYCAKRLKSAS
jgi:acyl carrier protein